MEDNFGLPTIGREMDFISVILEYLVKPSECFSQHTS